MLASTARLLRIKPLPASEIPRILEATPASPQPPRERIQKVAEQLMAMPDRPANLRVEPFVHRKTKYWKVSEAERTVLQKELREA
ncbi:hypothetical protein Malapachy_3414 [Malassezia pachydermatis]|uniref:Uncharacterized protein n=1 Tax=Malassezia pachydermatis TaxID=77020 RepID=A0A0M9VR53_9BASI|nr:hypothetical protein Malapachy_3414 [Malassezia pachydermatis]KOS16233.1 hypothetical protein Malapachy_3414 [Malassezia pachydermatis]